LNFIAILTPTQYRRLLEIPLIFFRELLVLKKTMLSLAALAALSAAFPATAAPREPAPTWGQCLAWERGAIYSYYMWGATGLSIYEDSWNHYVDLHSRRCRF
jgi:hypothetical protein